MYIKIPLTLEFAADLIQAKGEWGCETALEGVCSCPRSLISLLRPGQACDLLVTIPIYTEVTQIFRWHLYCCRKTVPSRFQENPKERSSTFSA